jgi:hypothetical protein
MEYSNQLLLQGRVDSDYLRPGTCLTRARRLNGERITTAVPSQRRIYKRRCVELLQGTVFWILRNARTQYFARYTDRKTCNSFRTRS